MSNVVENVLVVSGKHSDITSFDLKFRADKENTDENYSFKNLYSDTEQTVPYSCEWCEEHWGVKGDFDRESFARDTIRQGEMETYYYFDTENKSPELLIMHVSADFPELEFTLISGESGSKSGTLVVFDRGKEKTKEQLSEADASYWFGDEEE